MPRGVVAAVVAAAVVVMVVAVDSRAVAPQQAAAFQLVVVLHNRRGDRLPKRRLRPNARQRNGRRLEKHPIGNRHGRKHPRRTRRNAKALIVGT